MQDLAVFFFKPHTGTREVISLRCQSNTSIWLISRDDTFEYLCFNQLYWYTEITPPKVVYSGQNSAPPYTTELLLLLLQYRNIIVGTNLQGLPSVRHLDSVYSSLKVYKHLKGSMATYTFTSILRN